MTWICAALLLVGAHEAYGRGSTITGAVLCALALLLLLAAAAERDRRIR